MAAAKNSGGLAAVVNYIGTVCKVFEVHIARNQAPFRQHRMASQNFTQSHSCQEFASEKDRKLVFTAFGEIVL